MSRIKKVESNKIFRFDGVNKENKYIYKDFELDSEKILPFNYGEIYHIAPRYMFFKDGKEFFTGIPYNNLNKNGLPNNILINDIDFLNSSYKELKDFIDSLDKDEIITIQNDFKSFYYRGSKCINSLLIINNHQSFCRKRK